MTRSEPTRGTDLAARSRRPHLVGTWPRADRALVLRGERGELQMADYGVAVSWGEVKPGREVEAFEAWGEAAARTTRPSRVHRTVGCGAF